MKNCPEAIVDTEGTAQKRVWVRLNAYGGFAVCVEGADTGYSAADKHTAVELARHYCLCNNCRLVDSPDGVVKAPLPMFEAYVDQLAKQGLIDGNITERLMAFHRQEVSDPRAPVREALRPILDEMYHAANGTTLEHLDAAKLAIRLFADRIDDAMEG